MLNQDDGATFYESQTPPGICTDFTFRTIMSTIVASIFEKIRLCVLKRGKLPRHVAFVADGARRFGRKYAIPVQENHEIGYDFAIFILVHFLLLNNIYFFTILRLQNCMFEVIDWCLQLGIREYSILMFAFGNYYRPDDETQHWKIVLKIWLIKCIINWLVFCNFRNCQYFFVVFGKDKF